MEVVRRQPTREEVMRTVFHALKDVEGQHILEMTVD